MFSIITYLFDHIAVLLERLTYLLTDANRVSVPDLSRTYIGRPFSIIYVHMEPSNDLNLGLLDSRTFSANHLTS